MSSTNNKSFNTCIIYHNHCNDGFGSALAAKQIFGESAIYWPANHDQDPPDVKGMDVYILDYCYKRPILENMVKVANKVIVIDHHKTAKAELADMEETSKFQKVFDMNHSGAVLTYKYFFPNEKLPLLFSYIEDRDIWLKKMPDTDEVSAALFDLPKEFSIWEEYLVDKNIDKLIDIGKKVLAHIEVEVNNLARNSYLDEWSLILDKPKSAHFTFIFPSTKTFKLLISRCTT